MNDIAAIAMNATLIHLVCRSFKMRLSCRWSLAMLLHKSPSGDAGLSGPALAHARSRGSLWEALLGWLLKWLLGSGWQLGGWWWDINFGIIINYTLTNFDYPSTGILADDMWRHRISAMTAINSSTTFYLAAENLVRGTWTDRLVTVVQCREWRFQWKSKDWPLNNMWIHLVANASQTHRTSIKQMVQGHKFSHLSCFGMQRFFARNVIVWVKLWKCQAQPKPSEGIDVPVPMWIPELVAWATLRFWRFGMISHECQRKRCVYVYTQCWEHFVSCFSKIQFANLPTGHPMAGTANDLKRNPVWLKSATVPQVIVELGACRFTQLPLRPVTIKGLSNELQAEAPAFGRENVRRRVPSGYPMDTRWIYNDYAINMP